MTCGKCGALVRVDTTELMAMVVIPEVPLGVIPYRCMNGHAKYEGPEPEERGWIPTRHDPVFHCAICGDALPPSRGKQRIYCPPPAPCLAEGTRRYQRARSARRRAAQRRKVCRVCGVEFIDRTRNHNQKSCSPECANRYACHGRFAEAAR